MEFDDIQSAWKNENTEGFSLPNNLDKLQSANMPLDKIRKNLKNEFIYQILSIFFIGLVPLHSKFPEKMIAIYYLLYAVMVAISIYYLGKLFFFYKRINKANLNAKDNLYEIYTDIRINMELYKTFSFALIPFLILFLLGSTFYNNSKATQLLNGNIETKVLMIVMTIVIFCILFMAIATEWWIHKFYGKYAKEIRKVLDELKE